MVRDLRNGLSSIGARLAGTALAVAVAFVGLAVPTTAQAAVGTARIDLKVLVLSDNLGTVEPLTTALTREGVPFTTVNVASSHAAISLTGGPNPLSISGASPRALYQAVVAPTNLADLDTLYPTFSGTERAALETYQRAFRIRQVDVNAYPSASVGLNTPVYSGKLDGSTATLTAAATSGPFSYLDGSLTLDDNDPEVDEVYGYVGTPVSPALAGTTFTPLVTVPSPNAPTTVGSLLGVHSSGLREELVLTAAANSNQTFMQTLAHGIISWMTRGVYTGYDRHYYALHVDDVFLPDSRWSATGKCTPGDDCLDPLITEPRIRMVPSDVSRVTAWQAANDFTFDMVFNGGGNELEVAEFGTDALTPALLAAKNQFRWINHTYTHPFLGCQQDTSVRPFQCMANPGPGNVVTGDTNKDHYKWRPLTSADPFDLDNLGVQDEVQRNKTWATANSLPNYNPAELVTGEHSGLLSTPQQVMDNPNLSIALKNSSILLTGSDASREPNIRNVCDNAASSCTTLSNTPRTLPRYPSNIYYNAATYTDEVSEYNYVYTKVADGGGGACEVNAASTCITPLPYGTPAQAEASFKNFIVPLETKIALAKVLTNDPRPHYAHQSNLAEDAILLTTTKSVLDAYRGVFADNAPITSPTMTEAATVMTRASTWEASGKAATAAYLDGTGVHLTGGAATVPLTVPTGTTGTAVANLSAYAGSLSGWTGTNASLAVANPGDVGYGNGTTPVAPTAPAAPTGVPGDTNVALTWVAPADGNAPITSYTITPFIGAVAQTPIVTPAVPAGTAVPTTLTVPGLVNGTAYTFTVVATNAVGASAASPASAALTPRTLPGAPTSVTGVVGEGSVAVSWTAPASNGGSTLTSYTVTPYLGAVAQTPVVTAAVPVGTPPPTTLAVTGLTNGSAYTFTVAATSVAGTGPASVVSAAFTPRTKPAAPTAVSGVVGDRQVALSWTAPAVDGGSPVTTYTITPFVGAVAQTPVVTATNATSHTVTGLANGTAYTFTVAATNVAGTGVPSAASTAVTPVTVPDAPTAVTGVSSSTQVALTWTPPVVSGGTPVTAYVVTPYVGSTALTPIVTPNADAALTVTGLTNGTTYSFKVRARNAVGDGVDSLASGLQTPITVPAAPTAVTGVPGDEEVALSWTASADGGSAITSYTVTPSIGGVAQTPIETATGATSLTVSDLENGTAYTFTVAARNAAGLGAASAPSAARTPRTVPGVVPAAPAVTPDDEEVALTWTVPATDGGAAITSYSVTPYLAGVAQTPIDTGDTDTSFTVTGLENGTAYTFTVAAKNVAGTGAASAASAVVKPRTKPGAPTNVAGVVGDTQVPVSWTAPVSNGGAEITGYTVTSSPGAKTCTTTGALSCTVTGLTNGTAYTFTVTATNVAGTSSASAESNPVTPRTLPGAPTGLSAAASDESITLTWNEPASNGGLPIEEYRIVQSAGGVETVVNTGATATTKVLSDLSNGTAYTFTVAATTGAGTGAASASVAATPRTVPGVVGTPVAKRGDKSVALTWSAPGNGGSAITGYVLTPYKGGVAQPAVTLVGTATARTLTGLVNGAAYQFTVAAKNVAGTGATSAKSATVTPSGAPTVALKPLAKAAAPITLQAVNTFSWTGTANGSAIDHYDVFVKRAAYGKALPAAWTKAAAVKTTSFKVTLKPGETVLLGVRAVDKVGTPSALMAERSTVSLPMKKALKAKGAGWKKLVKSAYYGGSALRSSTKGATVKAGTVTSATRFAITASTGPKAGKVAIYVGGKKVATVNLKAKRADADGVVLTKTFKARSGAVTIVVGSTKQVRIQGISVVR